MVFLLDGGAVLDRLTDARLAGLPQDNPAVIVTLGHRTDQRYATAERARDYTPPGSDGGPVEDPRGRPGGGAADFLAQISEAVLPRVARIAPIDLSQSTLWGHSYGGLFVLYAASRPEAPFAHYVSASPSLWWDHGNFLIRITAQIEAGRWSSRRLELHHGGQERKRASSPANPNAQKLVQMRAALPPDALQGLDAALRAAGIPGGVTTFPGLSHGESFGASVDATLNAAFSATD
ncbi:alpha/beta hydrolase [Ponticoccus litoralis]|uniref:Alpha/beta hydrolase-fold protein n=1 Tax=Ponticoccus litoralis TaxID=422297 RepID=A0AAW9SVU2_9RHOB